MDSHDSDIEPLRHSRFVVAYPDAAEEELTITLTMSYRDAWIASINLGAMSDVTAVERISDALQEACRDHRRMPDVV